MDGNPSNSSFCNPWPYLNSFFEFKLRNGNSLKFICLLCKPKATEISAYANSPSNLGKHIKAKHGPYHLERYQDLTSLARKRKIVTDTGANKQRKLTSGDFAGTSQSTFDKRLISLIAQGLLPFEFVELPAFKQFVNALQPCVQIMSQAALTQRIDVIADSMRKNVITALSKVEYVATTIDCWSAGRHSFIGLTAHWIDSSLLGRCTAALACRRLKGSHTYDALACAIDEIHSAYGIRDKVIWSTTDNGSNFLKDFSNFILNDDGASENIQCEGDEEGTETDAQFTDACEVLASGSSLEYKLPTHQRCACHTLLLIATKDSLQAEANDDKFKKLNRTTFAKLASVWNKVGRSTTAAETVEKECGLQLIQPNQTTWNSLYLAVERIVLILRLGGGETALRNVFNSFEVPMLNAVEQDFVKDYYAVMKPVAKAIDILQSVKNAYMGWLLPTLEELLMKLERAEDSARFCKPLASAILKGIRTRFAATMEDPQLISAAILLPKFRTEWMSNDAIIQKGLKYLRQKLAETTTMPLESTSEEDFFSSLMMLSRSVSNKSSELATYLSAVSRDPDVLHSMPAIKKLFMLLNTPLPASAVCERLFSSAVPIFTPKLADVGSKNFENQLLLKLNHKYCG